CIAKPTPTLVLTNAGSVSIRITDGKPGAFEVEGLEADELQRLTNADLKPNEWSALFAVFVKPKDGSDPASSPSMLGAYSVTETVFRFEPRFPLQPGVEYLTVFDSSKPPLARSPGVTLRTTFKLAKPATAPSTVVERIYPTSTHLP